MGSEFYDDHGDQKALSKFPSLSTLSLSLSFPLISQSPDNSGTKTPPIQTTAAVPFRWEEEPGKPLPCTALIRFPSANSNKQLELQLPPRLLRLSSSSSKTTSPTTVLGEGPFVAASTACNMIIQSSSNSNSMRFMRSDYKQSSRGQLGDMVLIKKNRGMGKIGFFKAWSGKKTNHGDCDGDSKSSYRFWQLFVRKSSKPV